MCCLCHEDLIPNRQAVIDVVDVEDVTPNHQAVIDVVDAEDVIDVNPLALIDVDVAEEDTVISFVHFFN